MISRPHYASLRLSSFLKELSWGLPLALVIGLAVTLLASIFPSVLLVALVLFLIFISTSEEFSKRIGINVILFLGLAPILWWGTSTLSLGKLINPALLCVFFLSSFSVISILRSKRLGKPLWGNFYKSDLSLGFLGIVIWLFYFPVFNHSDNYSAVAALMNALSGDIVAHFDMYTMTIKTGLGGMSWGTSPDGSLFVYEPYPQHFHTLAAILGNSFPNNFPSEIENLAVGFLKGTIACLSLALIGLSALMLSTFRRIGFPWLAIPLIASTTAIFLVGFGATNLQAGFPNFVLAVFGVLLSTYLFTSTPKQNFVALLSQASCVVLVANSWLLLTPLCLGIFMTSAFLFWKTKQTTSKFSRAIWLSATLAFAGMSWAIVLTLIATYTAGGPAEVLNIPGGTPAIPFSVKALSLIATLGLLVFLWRSKISPARRQDQEILFPSLISLTIGSAIIMGLLSLQLLRGDSAFYYLQKFSNGVFLVSLVTLLTLALLASVKWISQLQPKFSFTAIGFMAVALTAVILFIPVGTTGIDMRNGLISTGSNYSDSNLRIIQASEVLASWPCKIPIYLGAEETDTFMNVSNQWAHALSGTWTESSANINDYLANNDRQFVSKTTEERISDLLTGFPQSCVIVSPAIFNQLDQEVLEKFNERVSSWNVR